MPSDSIAGFLDHAKAARVLFPEQVEQLIRQPDIPHHDLDALCSYLLERGVLTRYQADAIRDARWHDLSFAGYPVIDQLGLCPGGRAFKALHPSLRTPLVLRKLNSDSFGPADNAAAVIGRARTFGTLSHPHLLPLLDAGVSEDQAYAVFDQPADSADLETLLQEIGGAMPGFLAAEYGHAVASALRAVHERGGWHGEVRPGLLVVSPLTTKTSDQGATKRRPAPSATVKLAETGLIPVYPPASLVPPSREALPYLPPERIGSSGYTAGGDIYGLGATLYAMLAGRAPFSGESSEELLNKIATTDATDLAAMRPDIPAELAAYVMKMMAKKPEDRPPTAHDVEVALATYCRPGTTTVASQFIPQASPVSSRVVGQPVPLHQVMTAAIGAVPHALPVAQEMPVAPPAPESDQEQDGWGVGSNAFAIAHAASTADRTQPRRRQLTDADKSKSRMWIVVGALLHLTAVGLLVAWALGAFDSPPQPDPEPKKVEPKSKNTKPKIKRDDD